MAAIDVNKPNIVEAGALPLYEELLKPERTEAEQLAAVVGLWSLAFKCKDHIIKQDGCVNGTCLFTVATILQYAFIKKADKTQREYRNESIKR